MLISYWSSDGCSSVLLLIRVTRGSMRYVAHMLLLFFGLLLAAAITDSLGSSRPAESLSQIATLVLGMVLIRQAGLIMFRLIFPKFGTRSARIDRKRLVSGKRVTFRLDLGGRRN